MKQKMIDEMAKALEQGEIRLGFIDVEAMLDAALTVAADPANWTLEMGQAVDDAWEYEWIGYKGEFAAVINHIKGLPS